MLFGSFLYDLSERGLQPAMPTPPFAALAFFLCALS
jgi:hypothetical protein